MRVPFLIWLVLQTLKLLLLPLRWLIRSAVNCINNQGWWKSIAAMLMCIVVGYLFVSAVRPDVSQDWRDRWRSMFRNVPRITVIITTPVPTIETIIAPSATSTSTNTPAPFPLQSSSDAIPYPTQPPPAVTQAPTSHQLHSNTTSACNCCQQSRLSSLHRQHQPAQTRQLHS